MRRRGTPQEGHDGTAMEQGVFAVVTTRADRDTVALINAQVAPEPSVRR